MPFRIERFEENVRKLLEGPATKKLLRACKAYKERTSPSQRIIAIRDMMELLDREVARPTRRKLMESCGRQCITEGVLKKALRLKRQGEDLDDLLVRLNEAHIGGAHLRREGDVIHLVFERCYCGAVSKTKTAFSPTFCYCSCGWSRQLFETLLEKPIKVELLGSIIMGDDACQFKIHVK